MKINKATYLSFFFLLCFLTSFGTRTYQNLNTTYSKTSFLSCKQCSLSTNETGKYMKTEFIFEENENESENDFELQALVLPFFISYFQNKLVQLKTISAPPLAEKLTNPIYLSVCNFRI